MNKDTFEFEMLEEVDGIVELFVVYYTVNDGEIEIDEIRDSEGEDATGWFSISTWGEIVVKALAHYKNQLV